MAAQDKGMSRRSMMTSTAMGMAAIPFASNVGQSAPSESLSPIRQNPLPSLPLRFGIEEVEYLTEALKSNDLNYFHKNSLVSRTLDRIKTVFKSPYAVTTSSGTASLHVAVGAARIEAGSEVVTTPITDAGTGIAILFQNAIPVFADVDPVNSNLTAKSIEAVITERTKAVIVVHLTGSPADMDPIVELCKDRKLTLIEDCAQALGCTYKGKPVGTFGQFGCFSLNNQKHITAGEGGFVLMNNEDQFYLAHNFADKFYDRHNKGVRLQGLGINYRMSELQGAVGLAQFDRLDYVVKKRQALGDYLTEKLSKIDGIIPQKTLAGGTCSYFYYWFRIDESKINISRDEFRTKLAAEGIPNHGAYLPWPLYQAPVYRTKNFFAGGVWPAEAVAGRTYDYNTIHLPVTEELVKSTIRLDLHEGFSMEDVDDCAKAIGKVASLHGKLL